MNNVRFPPAGTSAIGILSIQRFKTYDNSIIGFFQNTVLRIQTQNSHNNPLFFVESRRFMEPSAFLDVRKLVTQMTQSAIAGLFICAMDFLTSGKVCCYNDKRKFLSFFRERWLEQKKHKDSQSLLSREIHLLQKWRSI